ncbi:hypothetical protein KQX54_002028, partial [Cotesia glomerata]
SKLHRKLQSQGGESAVTLSISARTRLEDLMMEGDLLEVALDETQDIWRILSHTNSPTTVRKYATFEEVQASFNSDMKDAKKRGRKRKSDEFDMGKTISRQKIVDEKSPANTPNAIIKKKGANTPTGGSGAGAGAGAGAAAGAAATGLNNKDKKIMPQSPLKRGPRKIKRKDGEDVPKKKGGNRKKTKQDTSDEEDDCAADSCLRPNGREVDWVQCDGGCNGWFHMHCVGLDKTELAEEDDYICSNCKDADQNTTSQGYLSGDNEPDIEEPTSFARTY